MFVSVSVFRAFYITDFLIPRPHGLKQMLPCNRFLISRERNRRTDERINRGRVRRQVGVYERQRGGRNRVFGRNTEK